MVIKTIIDEDFVNYKQPSMCICTAFCDGKCCKELNIPLNSCQNDEWRSLPEIEISDTAIIERYLSNPITKAICFSGLEPFVQFEEMWELIAKLRNEYHCDDTIVIYTGYTYPEIEWEINTLKEFKNIIVKFGRYVPDGVKHYDEVLGVTLASDNQYAERIS